jgi:TRAP-type C4-dicarboxylate transport system substrate-binding protein
MIRRARRIAAYLAALALLCPASRAADIPVVLKVADSLPVTHYMSTEGAKFFMSRATELSHGHITFEYYPSEQLGKSHDLLRLVQTSVADIGYVAPGYVSEKLPLSGVAELPGLYKSSCQGTHAFYALAHDGILDQREFKPNGVMVLMAWNLGPYPIDSSKSKLDSLDDFHGMKIRASGGTWDLILRAIGAVPVNFPVAGLREALERGTVDASVGTALSLRPYDLLGVTKTLTEGVAFGSFASTYSISLRKFRSLSAEDQSALVQAGREATEHLCEFVDTNEAAALADVQKAGVRVWNIPPADQAALRTMLDPVVQNWAKGLDDRHLPGSQVLADFKAAVK